jgi:hypothetical protein
MGIFLRDVPQNVDVAGRFLAPSTSRNVCHRLARAKRYVFSGDRW